MRHIGSMPWASLASCEHLGVTPRGCAPWLFAAAQAQLGPLYGLVNDAGILARQSRIPGPGPHASGKLVHDATTKGDQHLQSAHH